MKKLALLSVCILLSVKCLIANPLPVLSVDIMEIMFDSEKGWMLEVNITNMENDSIVKITVSSSSGSAESKYLPVFEEYEVYKLFVLTRDSLESDVYINPLGDKITVRMEYIESYDGKIHSMSTNLIFGDFSGSQIKAPFDWQSIGYAGHDWYASYYAKTNEPTIGFPNNVSKMRGTLTGKVYDKNNQLVINNFISFSRYYDPEIYPPQYVTIDENGSYSTQMLANRFSRNYVYMMGNQIQITPVSIDIEPDSTMVLDIYLLEDYTDIDEMDKTNKMNDFPILIYPNPLSGGQALQYEIGTPVKSLDCRIEVVAMDGRIVFESKITDRTGSINLPQTLSSGMYIVNFKLNNKTHYSNRLIIEQ